MGPIRPILWPAARSAPAAASSGRQSGGRDHVVVRHAQEVAAALAQEREAEVRPHAVAGVLPPLDEMDDVRRRGGLSAEARERGFFAALRDECDLQLSGVVHREPGERHGRRVGLAAARHRESDPGPSGQFAAIDDRDRRAAFRIEALANEAGPSVLLAQETHPSVSERVPDRVREAFRGPS